MLYIILTYVYLLALFVVLPFYLIRGLLALASKDVKKRSRAKHYLIISGITFAIAVAAFVTIVLFVDNLRKTGGVFL